MPADLSYCGPSHNPDRNATYEPDQGATYCPDDDDSPSSPSSANEDDDNEHEMVIDESPVDANNNSIGWYLVGRVHLSNMYIYISICIYI